MGSGFPGGAAAAGPRGGASGAVDNRSHPAQRGGDRRASPAARRTGKAPEDLGRAEQMSAADGSSKPPDLAGSPQYAAVVSDILGHPRHPDQTPFPATP